MTSFILTARPPLGERGAATGTAIGKALEAVTDTEGMIYVFVTLQ